MSKPFKLITAFVALAMEFGCGVLATPLFGLQKEWAVVIGVVLVLFGALYGTALAMYLYLRWRRDALSVAAARGFSDSTAN